MVTPKHKRNFGQHDQQLKQFAEANQAIETFRSDPDVHERARAGLKMKELLGDEDTPQEIREMVEGFSNSLKLDKWLDMYKTTQDLRKVSNSARSLLGGEEGMDGHRSLEDLSGDESLDPMAREVAKQFDKYLPIQMKAQKSGAKTKKLVDDEMYESNNGKPTIKDKDGNVIMRPAPSSDPRQLSILAETMEDLLTGKEMQTGSQGREPKPVDNLNGRPLYGSLTTGSKLSKDVANHLLEKSRDLDPERLQRLNLWLRNGKTEMDPQNQGPSFSVGPRLPPRPQPKPMEVVELQEEPEVDTRQRRKALIGTNRGGPSLTD